MEAAKMNSGRHWAYGFLSVYLLGMSSLSVPLSVVLILTFWLTTGGTQWCYLAANTLPRDLRLLTRGLKLIFRMIYVKTFDITIIKAFRQVLRKYPNRIMLVNATNGKEWSYSQMESTSNRIANYFLQRGYKKGDAIALFMENRPEFVVTWLGLAKIGIIPAFINYNLKKDALLHTINVADCRAIIYGLELENAVCEIQEALVQDREHSSSSFEFFYSSSGSEISKSSSNNITTFQSSMVGQSVNLDEAIKLESNPNPEPRSVSESISSSDNLLYIYTSGTTGLPKAVIIKHIRQLFAMYASHYIIGLSSEDIIYCHLPLYHSSGGQVATCSSLLFGARTIIRKKFSASNFWKDCVKYKITGTQYIGEIARYLLATKECPEERNHNVRIMFGNGLRPQIWTKFVERFNIPNIAEFLALINDASLHYKKLKSAPKWNWIPISQVDGSTEGNSNICNIDNRVGAVGFIPIGVVPEFLAERLLPLKLIKVNSETGEPLRDNDGYCIRCQPGEEGEFIGKIVKGDPVKDFTGYRDPAATKKKILQNVFREGDVYFRSGDILIMDEFGWLYFKDRRGDTFRWRGENVSTTEVEATISNILELEDCTSYGVQVPDTEGRAGMVAVPDPDHTLDLKKLFIGVMDKLPGYARPFFVRCVPFLDLTGTYKLKKRKLQAEGFDPNVIVDPLFFLDNKEGKFVPLTIELYDKILKGQIRL